MSSDRSTNLPPSGKDFGVMKEKQATQLDAICKEFAHADSKKLEKYKQMFITYDLDASGDIDIMELKQMMEKMGQAKTHLELQSMIKEVDTTNKGTINFHDFLRMMVGGGSSVLQKIIMFNEMASSSSSSSPAPSRSKPPTMKKQTSISKEIKSLSFSLGAIAPAITVTNFNEEVVMQKKIGKGSYGEVFKAVHSPTNTVMAIKSRDITKKKEIEELVSEVSILREARCDSIVKYFGYYIDEQAMGAYRVYIMMEYCALGSAQDVIDVRGAFKEDEISCMCRNILEALRFLHVHKKIHRDIKSDNVLIDGEGNAKLADFGISGSLKNTMHKRQSMVGTPYFMAPEVVSDVGYNTSADVWALGITLIQMAESRPPLYDFKPAQVLFEIAERPPPTLSSPSKWTKEFNDFISKCLVKDPVDRWSAIKLLEHPFVNKILDKKHLLAQMVHQSMGLKEERERKIELRASRSIALLPKIDEFEPAEKPQRPTVPRGFCTPAVGAVLLFAAFLLLLSVDRIIFEEEYNISEENRIYLIDFYNTLHTQPPFAFLFFPLVALVSFVWILYRTFAYSSVGDGISLVPLVIGVYIYMVFILHNQMKLLNLTGISKPTQIDALVAIARGNLICLCLSVVIVGVQLWSTREPAARKSVSIQEPEKEKEKKT